MAPQSSGIYNQDLIFSILFFKKGRNMASQTHLSKGPVQYFDMYHMSVGNPPFISQLISMQIKGYLVNR